MNKLFNQKIYLYQQTYPLLSDYEKKNYEKKFKIEYTHDSTQIEGNTLTLIETKMILEDGIVPKETRLTELNEIIGHADAWEFVKESVKEKRPITENFIKDIHELTVVNSGIGGMYRTVPVYISGSRHIPPAPHKVWNLMGNFVYQIDALPFDDAIHKAAWLHAELVKIHPFQDGNGRTSRLLMNYELMRQDYPATTIKADDKEKYFTTLEHYELTGDLHPFRELLQNNIEKQVDEFLRMYAIHIDIDKIMKESVTIGKLAKSYVEGEMKQDNCFR